MKPKDHKINTIMKLICNRPFTKQDMSGDRMAALVEEGLHKLTYYELDALHYIVWTAIDETVKASVKGVPFHFKP